MGLSPSQPRALGANGEWMGCTGGLPSQTHPCAALGQSMARNVGAAQHRPSLQMLRGQRGVPPRCAAPQSCGSGVPIHQPQHRAPWDSTHRIEVEVALVPHGCALSPAGGCPTPGDATAPRSPREAAAVRPIAVPTADPTSSTGGKTSHGAPGAPGAVPLSLSACAGAPSSLIKSNGPALPRAPARLAAPPGRVPGRCAVSSEQRHNKTPAVSWPGAQPAVRAGLLVAQRCVCPRCRRSPRRSARR